MGLILKDRIVIVVGGGSGLGRAIAHACAREGANLAIADLQADAARETLSSVGQLQTGLALSGDISNAEVSEGWIRAVAEKFGRVDVLVNCAAICLVDPLLEVTPEKWEKVFAINTKGAFFCMQAAARRMVPNGFGRIIQVSTPASRMGFPNFASYGASKAAVDSMVRSAALAWASHGVTVNSIVPGRMTGGMITKLDQDLARLSGKPDKELEEARTQSLPMKRRVAPEEVAEAAIWLASDAAAYVTGERFNFSGGMEVA